jgi:hypothetical protein
MRVRGTRINIAVSRSFQHTYTPGDFPGNAPSGTAPTDVQELENKRSALTTTALPHFHLRHSISTIESFISIRRLIAIPNLFQV